MSTAVGAQEFRMTCRGEKGVYLVVYGIAARCRKTDRHFIELGNEPETVMEPERIEEQKARARTKLLTFKTVEKATLHLDVGELRDGLLSFLLLDSRNVQHALT
jgi:hypothetical protein